MVGLVIVSHSPKLAEGLVELIAQMQPNLPIRAAGGMPDGSLGTNVDKVSQAIAEVDGPDGVLVLVDLGSAVMTAEVALEWLPAEQQARTCISGAPLVEGAVLAAMNATVGVPLAELARSVEEARNFPKGVKLASRRLTEEGRTVVHS